MGNFSHYFLVLGAVFRFECRSIDNKPKINGYRDCNSCLYVYSWSETNLSRISSAALAESVTKFMVRDRLVSDFQCSFLISLGPFDVYHHSAVNTDSNDTK